MGRILEENSNCGRAVKELIEKANEKGGRDNISVALLRHQGSETTG